MKEGFKPDFGLYVRENFPPKTIIQFVNLSINNIFRIGPKYYSLYTNYIFQDIEYALSLDFHFEVLPDLIELIEPYFNISDFANMVYQLTGPEEKHKAVEWNEAFNNICCSAILGQEEINANEKYIPFIVKKFY